MSYNFGQFRRVQKADTDYFKTVSPVNKGYIASVDTKSSLSQGIIFVDKRIELDGNNALQAVDNTGLKKKNYFLRFKVKRLLPEELAVVNNTENSTMENEAATQIITIRLVNSSNKDTSEDIAENIQTLTTIKVAPGTGYVTYDLVIAPNGTYNQIQFILNRVLYDYNNYNQKTDGYYGREIEILTEDSELILNEIVNVVDFLDIDEKGQLKQIGVQGPPGLQMCIDGEQIRIGRSGIYEINNGVMVNFIGFIVEPNDKKYFMLDYQY